MSIKWQEALSDDKYMERLHAQRDRLWHREKELEAEVSELRSLVERLTRERDEAFADLLVYKEEFPRLRSKLIVAERERNEARAERDGLAKALATIAQDQDSDWPPEDGPSERVPLHEADEMMAMARAALTALPPAPKEDDRIVSDGFGSEWVKCRLGERCGLHVVRPGKAACNADDCPEDDDA